ncbi:PLP-dependent transferase [Saitoella complicata NRRL Y-17804]|uniref:PLP-dependent transferase n=1 Tax=Saitoella complicata (strain BCRC 22490 / CBS 7301 / JCM 7358 / NBRC 10748 / NRRL Y-17804) TaxID=698492 RepID=UPI0008674398|nr:PLP-dependent transferase [Saitoella complicata NRRL Y-17804]ODQ50214.1 PLP-dependent transferase [Saitoella complicata NRRL Y-17804]
MPNGSYAYNSGNDVQEDGKTLARPAVAVRDPPPYPTSRRKLQYPDDLDTIRAREYPQLLPSALYLDHAASTPPPLSLLRAHHHTLSTTLLSNPHSSPYASAVIDAVREELLEFLGCEGGRAGWEVVWVSNTTAGIKLVGEMMEGACRDGGWDFVYHRESHTSILGLSGLASHSTCVDGPPSSHAGRPTLFAYPAQSNFSGTRFPPTYTPTACAHGYLTLLDAASLLPTSPLTPYLATSPPDFTVLSLTKLLGYPNLAALLIRRSERTVEMVKRRRYFGGGTVGGVTSDGWHEPRGESMAEALEDGTVSTSAVLCVREGIRFVMETLGGLERVRAHTSTLAAWTAERLRALRHPDGGGEVVRIHTSGDYADPYTQGPIIAFSILSASADGGGVVPPTTVATLAGMEGIHLRTGGLCNPGATEFYLGLTPKDVRRGYYEQGTRCGDGRDFIRAVAKRRGNGNGAEEGEEEEVERVRGVVRISFGACTTWSEVRAFVGWVERVFISPPSTALLTPPPDNEVKKQEVRVEALYVYPIKSCHAYAPPPQEQPWPVGERGLVFDRMFFLLDLRSGRGMSQKTCPGMARIIPTLDIEMGVMRVRVRGSKEEFEVPLHPREGELEIWKAPAKVCYDTVECKIFTGPRIQRFFSDALSTPDARVTCTLAIPSTPRRMTNESPLLLINSTSIAVLCDGMERIPPASLFRPNIVVRTPLPFVEDAMTSFVLHHRDSTRGGRGLGMTMKMEVSGPCRRCKMVSVDQESGKVEWKAVYEAMVRKRMRRGVGVVFGVGVRLTGPAGMGNGIELGMVVG